MKNTIKFLGIIALVAVIGFSMTGCLSLGGGDSGGGLGSVRATAEWPSEATWAQNNIQGGLQQPSGTAVTSAGSIMGAFTVTLGNANKAAFDNLVNQMEGKSGWTLHERKADRRNESVSFVTADRKSVVIDYDIRDNAITIMAR